MLLQLVFPGPVQAQSGMYNHFTVNCSWVHLTLGPCGSDSTQSVMRVAASDCMVIWYHVAEHSIVTRAQQQARHCFANGVRFHVLDGIQF